jgi:hypothetical protein
MYDGALQPRDLLQSGQWLWPHRGSSGFALVREPLKLKAYCVLRKMSSTPAAASPAASQGTARGLRCLRQRHGSSKLDQGAKPPQELCRLCLGSSARSTTCKRDNLVTPSKVLANEELNLLQHIAERVLYRSNDSRVSANLAHNGLGRANACFLQARRGRFLRGLLGCPGLRNSVLSQVDGLTLSGLGRTRWLLLVVVRC